MLKYCLIYRDTKTKKVLCISSDLLIRSVLLFNKIFLLIDIDKYSTVN